MRDNSVTIAKGMAIILMVMGHAGCPEFLNTFLAMIRMPLFFFMSGYCFKKKYLDNYKPYLKRRVIGVYWPYVKWAIFFLIIHNLLFKLNIYSDEYGYLGNVSQIYNEQDFISHAISIITRMTKHDPMVGGFWFLKALFVGSIIFFVTRRLFQNTIIGLLILAICAVILSYANLQIPYFYVGARQVLAASFIMIGHIYRQKSLQWHTNKYFIACAIIFVVVGSIYWPASMSHFTYLTIVPYIITSVVGTLALWGGINFLSIYNVINKFLLYVGEYTFNVLTWHFISMKLVSLIIVHLYGLPIKQLSEYPVIAEYASQGWWLVYFVVGVSIPIFGTYCYHLVKDIIVIKGS